MYYCLLNFLLNFYVNSWFTGYSALRLVISSRHHCVALLLGLRLLLGCRYDYTIHGSSYTSAHILIENTLVQHKMAKNSCMVLCCQNRVSKGTNQCYGLHDSANISVHGASVTVLGLLKKKKEKKKKKKKTKKKELVQNGVLAVFRLAT